MKTQYADLHMHTVYSDGIDSPANLVRTARMRGSNIIAITDHDTTRGYYEGKSEADKYGMILIPGVEVSTRRYHILGLNINVENPEFQDFLEYNREIQRKVCNARISKLAAVGFPISFEKVQRTFPESRLGKGNIFFTMLMDPECRAYFEKNVPDNPVIKQFGYVLSFTDGVKVDDEINSSEAIKAIHGAGGLAILAHPFKDVKQMSELDQMVEEGLDGLEVRPIAGEKNAPFEKYALEKSLIVTRGSDYHGALLDRPLLGRENGLKVGNLEELFRRQEVVILNISLAHRHAIGQASLLLR